MSIRKFLSIFAVSVFLIGTLATANALAGGWKQTLAEHEERIGILEGQVSDYEARINDLETDVGGLTTTVDGLEANDSAQDQRLDDLEQQIGQPFGIKVFDSSVPPEFVGILVNTVPQEISSSPQDLLVQPHITVFVPSLGKFLEMYWSGEHLTYRTQIPALYFDGPDCSGTAYTDRDGGSYVLLDNEYYLYEFKDENQVHSFYTIGRYTDPDPPVIQSMKWRVKDCENYVGDLSAYYPLTMVNTNLSFPFQQPLTFE